MKPAYKNHLRSVLLGVSTLGLSVGMAACQGPARQESRRELALPDPAALVIQMNDGPRADNAERQLEIDAGRMAERLFPSAPMPSRISQARTRPAAVESERERVVRRPSWADGVVEPSEAGGHDLPQSWPLEVRRGETPALLAEWAGVDKDGFLNENEEVLGKRRWLKVGDRLTITMSANEKVSFDRAREQFKKNRINDYFSSRYFEKVVVYRVKRGEYVSDAAKRYGDVPLWLIEEFNQIDFRSLQPGDEVLIPIIAQVEGQVQQPPPPMVVDEEGRPLSHEQSEALRPRLKGEAFARARMALDDGNIFERPRPGQQEVAGYRPEQRGERDSIQRPYHPAASIGRRPSHSVQAEPIVGGAYVGGVVGEEPEAEPASRRRNRDVIVKAGESLMHYVKWSGSSLDAIKAANPQRLDVDHIFVGSRITIPMSDEEYVDFVTARASWEEGRQAPKAAADGMKRHSVKRGENATAIARQYRIGIRQLREANPDKNLDRLHVGTELKIPVGSP